MLISEIPIQLQSYFFLAFVYSLDVFLVNTELIFTMERLSSSFLSFRSNLFLQLIC